MIGHRDFRGERPPSDAVCHVISVTKIARPVARARSASCRSGPSPPATPGRARWRRCFEAWAKGAVGKSRRKPFSSLHPLATATRSLGRPRNSSRMSSMRRSMAAVLADDTGERSAADRLAGSEKPWKVTLRSFPPHRHARDWPPARPGADIFGGGGASWRHGDAYDCTRCVGSSTNVGHET